MNIKVVNNIIFFIAIFLLLVNISIITLKNSDYLANNQSESEENAVKNLKLQNKYFFQKIPSIRVTVFNNYKKEEKNINEIFKNNEITILFYNSNINCNFCLKELSKWTEYFEKHKYPSIKFYVIFNDIGLDALKIITKKVNLKCPIIYDTNNILKNYLQINYSPTIFWVNKSGKIIFSFSTYLFKVQPDSFFKNISLLKKEK